MDDQKYEACEYILHFLDSLTKNDYIISNLVYERALVLVYLAALAQKCNKPKTAVRYVAKCQELMKNRHI